MTTLLAIRFSRSTTTLFTATLTLALLGAGCEVLQTTDGGVTDAGVDAGRVDAGLTDGGADPLTCSQWEERVREGATSQLRTDSACTEGFGGGCDLQSANITCDDGATVGLCLATQNSQEPIDLAFACDIPREPGCAINESCDGKACWCVGTDSANPRRQVVTDQALAAGCLPDTEVFDTCSNEGEICSVNDVEGCFTDQCTTTCQPATIAACIDGQMRSYVTEFPRCQDNSFACIGLCFSSSPTVLCHETPECADDVCSDDCIVSVCDGDSFIIGVPRTDVFPCDADGGVVDAGAVDAGAVDAGVPDAG